MSAKMTVVHTNGTRSRFEAGPEMTFGLHLNREDRKILLPVAHHQGEEYVRDYNRGWAASGRRTVSSEWDAGYGTVGFDDGYMDRAASREKWHLAWCDDHGECGRY